MRNLSLIGKTRLIPMLVLTLFTNITAQYATIDLANTHQRIRGFGAANILPWRPDMTDSEIKTAFGTEEGQLGFTILRLMIEPTQNNWSLSVRTAQKAHDMGVLIFASPWNAPTNMLETVNGLKRVRYDKYEDYAYHLDDFKYFMEDKGVPLYAVSVQNEPDYGDWTRWTAQEMLTFMRDYASIIGTRVMAPESFQFRRGMSDPILNDSLACSNLDIVGGHIYGAGVGSYPLAVNKGKEVWMTEHYTESQNSGNLWPLALNVGTEINNVMYAGMNAYVWWYIVRFYGPISDGTNNSGKKGEVTKRGYIMSQFARFIRPGYYRIECPRQGQSNVWCTAYKDSASSKIVIVAVNTSSQAKNQTFIFQNGHVGQFTPYVTSETKNCSRENDIIVSNDSLNVTLDGSSVTTFVSSGNGVVSVEDASSGPASFKLFQNYPNPFNPTTNIEFTLSKAGQTTLQVCNIQGRLVETLVDNNLDAGLHTVHFAADNLSAGIYYYRIRHNDFTDAKKMILIK